MTGPGWIVIPNWDELQHYKNREVPWIKSYTRLLAKPEYLTLTPADRGILHGLWLLYAESGCAIPALPRYCAAALHAQVSRSTLERLNHAGFIQFSSRQPSSIRLDDSRARATRSREEETETEEPEGSHVNQKHDVKPLDHHANGNQPTTTTDDDPHQRETPTYEPKEIPW